MNLFSWLFASSQVFFSCSGDLVHTSNFEGYPTYNSTEKVTASLMLDEAKQAFAFKSTTDIIDAVFAKDPDDVAHKRLCYEIYEREDKRRGSLPYQYHRCGDVWSDDTSFHFKAEDNHVSYDSKWGSNYEEWKGSFDRVTGHFEVELNSSATKPKSWGKANWSLICKKVDKLVDAK